MDAVGRKVFFQDPPIATSLYNAPESAANLQHMPWDASYDHEHTSTDNPEYAPPFSPEGNSPERAFKNEPARSTANKIARLCCNKCLKPIEDLPHILSPTMILL